MATFHVRFDADWTLDVEDIWPDGDAPANPTAEDVRRVIMECGGILRVMRDWDLVTDGSDFSVARMEG